MDDAADIETQALAQLLERKGYSVQDLSGTEAPPLSGLVRLRRGDEALTCAVHRTRMGRMSFSRRDDGTFEGLDDAAHILHTAPASKSALRVSLFRRAVVLAAIEVGWIALQAEGKGRATILLNPQPEQRDRFAGSGFGEAAEWIAVMEYGRPVAPGLGDTEDEGHIEGEGDIGLEAGSDDGSDTGSDTGADIGAEAGSETDDVPEAGADLPEHPVGGQPEDLSGTPGGPASRSDSAPVPGQPDAPAAAPPPTGPDDASQGDVPEQVRQMLATHFRVAPEQLDIEVRIRI